MKKVINFLIVISVFFFLSRSAIYARSGCCSWHGGVCGCGCCDGTPLSSTCAPYYPECSGGYTYSIPTIAPLPTIPICPLFSNYDYASGRCKCMYGYVTSGNQCISQDQACKNQYGYNSQTNYTGGCNCIYSYVWDDSGTSCISGNQFCWDKHGISSTYDSLNKSCKCLIGYHFEGSQCVLDIPKYAPPVKRIYTYPTNTPYIAPPTSTSIPIPTKNTIKIIKPTLTPTSTTKPTISPQVVKINNKQGFFDWLFSIFFGRK